MKEVKRRRTSLAKAAAQDFLLEIGCEELPADYMPAILDWYYPQDFGLSESAALVLSKNKVVWKKLQSFGTPRRLVLKVDGVEPGVEEEVEGPPVSIAFDSQGRPTEASKGFARKLGVSVEKLKRMETARGPRLVWERRLSVTKILGTSIPHIIQGIKIPKTMRWDESGMQFARPIRWFLALYGSETVFCTFGRVKGGCVTYGTRRYGSKPVSVKSVSDYFKAVSERGMELAEGIPLAKQKDGQGKPADPHWSWQNVPRRKALCELLREKAKSLGGQLAHEGTEEFQWLLNTATFLAENPVVEVGSFQKNYLDLPPEVLATSMVKYLKLFSVYTSDGKKLLPKFLAVLEGRPQNPSLVMANIDRIIEAKFSDARFFYREDTRTPLEKKVAELDQVIFHEKLGTVKDRIARLQRIGTALLRELKLSHKMEDPLSRAVRLCKADLVTQLVREFPSLQGIMGGHYAKASGESEEIVRAITEQYRPRTMNEPVPATPLGALLSVVDRIDTLVGYFAAGIKPTGSVDPYALRRQALGAVRILMDPPPGISFEGLSIDRLFDEGIQSWGSKSGPDSENLKKELRAFVRERFEWIVLRDPAMKPQLIDAVLAAGEDDLADAWRRLKILQRLWSRPPSDEGRLDLIRAAKVAERTGRMVKSAQEKGFRIPEEVDSALLKEPAEKELWSRWKKVEPTLKEQVRERDSYEGFVHLYGSLSSHVHEFFEKVLVMAEDEQVRRNRLSLVNKIHRAVATSFADLSKLPLSDVDPLGLLKA